MFKYEITLINTFFVQIINTIVKILDYKCEYNALIIMIYKVLSISMIY